MTDLTTLKEVLYNQLKYSGGDHPITANRLISIIERAEKCQGIKDEETKSAEKLFTEKDMKDFARCAVNNIPSNNISPLTNTLVVYLQQLLNEWRTS